MRAVMIMFDTLTRDFLPNYGNDWVKAPNFDKLREKTITFDNFYGGSMPCMPARRELHTGRYNFMHRMWGQLEPFDHSVFEVLQKNGIYCHLVTDHSHYFEDGGATYHNRYSTWEGFRGQEGDRWVPRKNKEEDNTNPLNKKGISAEQHYANRTRQKKVEEMSSVKTVQAGIDFLTTYQQEDNWFLQIECFDPHEPFYVPDEFRKLYDKTPGKNPFFWPRYGKMDDTLSADALEELRNEYAALISLCDQNLGRLLRFFDENRMWEDTLIIINTDHGFLLGEHNWLGKNIAPMYEEIIHLPFFLSHPDLEKGTRSTMLSQTIDLPATLLDFFKVDNQLDMDGKSIIESLKKNTSVHEIHPEVIFGTNGGHVNIFDGRYVYMRAAVDPSNGPLKIQTLNFSQMRGFIKKEILDQMLLKKGNRFTNQFPYAELEVSTFIDSYSIGHLLFDLEKDKAQEMPLDNPEIEERMIQKLLAIMKKIEVPESEYIRLGIESYL
ncbi:sulfatase [Listeria fleischmannii subsp. coloradonensis]|uniref:Sulfatase n=2 Tax=Listeria fleischmannii TaxID=1069827 RepID=A0A841YBK4_9LIST|nr:sulfatase [Listeria fleischmannii subsp. coloradonensis]MBC1397579.1 sulfatase [Listeria fleischmannii]MBC1425948.1 sulfatase [Listeria fleischmannii]STY35030.1 Arylsulfatase [Listeria fleischmannii subsp. coloradonensis]